MPDSKTHSFLTAQALKLQKKDLGNCDDLIKDYCSYPDFYFSDRWQELEKYIFFLDGIQFHYLPDTPYNELYRYWKMNQNGGFLSRDFVNKNFRHAEKGFTFYITHAVRYFQNGNDDEAKKYLGCLLHMLEDSTFGFHTLEGAGGADGFVLDRMLDSSPSPADILAKIKMDFTLHCPAHEVQILGDSIDEAVMMLYGKYCSYSADSRKAAFQYILSELGFSGKNSSDEIRRMHDNAVKLCADVIATILHLATDGKSNRAAFCSLNTLEPYQFPFGGFGAYRFRSFIRDCAILPDGSQTDLQLNGRKLSYGLSFGSHFKGSLLYKIAPETFKNFTVSIGFQDTIPPGGEVCIEWLNNSETAATVTLSEKNPVQKLQINAPSGVFGLKFTAKPSCGIIVLGEPHFEYK